MCSNRSEFQECDANNRAIITETNPDITRWPYRYEALTVDESPLKAAIGLCNQRLYPPDVASKLSFFTLGKVN